MTEQLRSPVTCAIRGSVFCGNGTGFCLKIGTEGGAAEPGQREPAEHQRKITSKFLVAVVLFFDIGGGLHLPNLFDSSFVLPQDFINGCGILSQNR